MPVGLPSLSIATELKSALEWSGAGAGSAGGEERSLSEEEISRSGMFGVLVSVVVRGTKVAVDAGGRVAVDAGGTKVAVDAEGGTKVAVAVAVGFVATASMILNLLQQLR